MVSPESPKQDKKLVGDRDSQSSIRADVTKSKEGGEGPSFQDEAQILGEKLTQSRKAKEWSIADVSEKLNLVERTIECLESAQFEVLKLELVYIEGYYRSYAKLLGVSLAGTRFDLPVSELRIDEPEVANPILLEPQGGLFAYLRRHADGIVVSLIVIVVLAVAILIWRVWPDPTSELTNSESNLIEPLSNQSTGDPESEELPFYLRDEDSSLNDELAGDTATSEGDVATAVESDLLEQAPEPTDDVAVETESLVPASELNAVEEPTAATTTGSLRMDFTGLSWIEVIDASDDTLYRRMGNSGESITVSGELPLAVRVGDVSTVRMFFNGEEVDLQPISVGSVANFTLE